MVALTPTGKQSLDALVAKAVEDKKIPGFVFGATSVDEEIYFNAGGNHIVDDPSSAPVTEDTVFWICSQTKLLTHLAALQLIERGKLAEEDPVVDYLPQMANPVIVEDEMADNLVYKPAQNVIRVKHLLNFTSGTFYPFKDATLDNQLEAYATLHPKDDHITGFFNVVKGTLPGVPLRFEPGTNFAYGWSSDILGFVIEKASGQRLDDYLKENIFNPLGMKPSFHLTPELKAKLLPITYRRDGKLERWANQGRLIEQDPSKVTAHLGGVGVYSSLKDYLNLLRHLLQILAGKATNPILKLEAVQSIFVPTLPEAGSKSLELFLSMFPHVPKGTYSWGNALALNTSAVEGGRSNGTGFWSGWASTFHLIDPTKGVAVVFGTQLLPAMDAEILKASLDFENALYAALE
ncbi:hypothetical protein M413DRAFT_447549 [Hebeloma cylindrosporum]|uniref:Beta-lactamase-related domain-containing protein n=1 Tax=Hebeloma cylindrosporum TaxID=76867 RepID=A0A0C2YCU5_HEBCY|nr:hypothetical protein M413DRAFT_447549 [Hebeloma cylindrosporum h7]